MRLGGRKAPKLAHRLMRPAPWNQEQNKHQPRPQTSPQNDLPFLYDSRGSRNHHKVPCRDYGEREAFAPPFGHFDGR